MIREALLDKLREIHDPCSVAAGKPMDIVGMGLIGDIRTSDDGTVLIPLVLTEPACWFTGDILRFVEDKAMQVPGVTAVQVFLDPDEVWTPDRMERPYRSPVGGGPRATPRSSGSLGEAQ